MKNLPQWTRVHSSKEFLELIESNDMNDEVNNETQAVVETNPEVATPALAAALEAQEGTEAQQPAEAANS